MDQLIALAQTISKKFILAENAYANSELIKLSQLLLQSPELQKNPELQVVIGTLVQAHQNKNYIYIADLIEYELIPLLLSKH